MTLTMERLWGSTLFLTPLLLLTTKNGSVAAIALALIISLYLLFTDRGNIKLSQLDWLFTICFCAYFISVIPITIIDGDNFRYFRGGSRILPLALVYLALRNIHLDTKRMRPLVEWGTILGLFGAFLLAVFQYYVEGRPRVDGFLYSINFGYLNCALSFIAFCLAKRSKYKALLYSCFVLGCATTLMTLTRGAIFAIPILIALATLLRTYKFKPKKLLVAIIVLITISIALYEYAPAVKNRLDYTSHELSEILSGDINKSTSTGARIQLWIASIEAIKNRPSIGSTYAEREQQIQKMYEMEIINRWTTTVNRGHAHSQYFEMMASGGLLGIAAFILMLFVPLGYFLRHSRQSDYAYIGAVFVAGFCIYCLTEAALQQNLISTFYGFMLAVFLAFTQQELADKKDSSP
ncbi:O-antigen ligase family protein [Vibrio sp. HN007]|uniref:O-antigen ligase family protein n=1 Tax=Vibrio iocasae TaxID=3098914 RepID=UPI0035D3FC24